MRLAAEAPGLQGIRDGYVDAITAVNAWELMETETKAALRYVCCGVGVPNFIDIPPYLYTIDNLDTPRWGAPLNWGDMIREYEDFDDWPALDNPLVATPTVDMKQPGY